MSDTVSLNGQTVGGIAPTYLIAEIGSNHNRCFDTATEMIDLAHDAGCDAVKFQSYTADGLYSIYTPRTSEMDGRCDDSETPYELIKRIQMPVEWHPDLKAYCDKVGIAFCSSPFDESMVEVLEQVDIPFYKIASFEITHYPLLKLVAQTGKPIILATGNSDLDDVKAAVATLRENGCQDYALLHCVSQYPAQYQDMNLRCISHLRETFGCVVGLSDHTENTFSSVLAVGLGASIIEKHITLDKTQPGPDHPFAMNPDDLREWVKQVRKAEVAMGTPIKRVLPGEEENHRIGRRSIIAARDIAKGAVLSLDDLVIKRPAMGIHPKHLDNVIAKRTACAIKRDEWLTWENLA